MTFGSDVEVVEPVELRERMLHAAEEVVALYR
jgi:predicted DNA-binding transcriptional regulator YafY